MSEKKGVAPKKMLAGLTAGTVMLLAMCASAPAPQASTREAIYVIGRDEAAGVTCYSRLGWGNTLSCVKVP